MCTVETKHCIAHCKLEVYTNGSTFNSEPEKVNFLNLLCVNIRYHVRFVRLFHKNFKVIRILSVSVRSVIMGRYFGPECPIKIRNWIRSVSISLRQWSGDNPCDHLKGVTKCLKGVCRMVEEAAHPWIYLLKDAELSYPHGPFPRHVLTAAFRLAVAPLKELCRRVPFVPARLTVEFRSGTKMNLAGIAIRFWLHPASVVGVIYVA